MNPKEFQKIMEPLEEKLYDPQSEGITFSCTNPTRAHLSRTNSKPDGTDSHGTYIAPCHGSSGICYDEWTPESITIWYRSEIETNKYFKLNLKTDIKDYHIRWFNSLKINSTMCYDCFLNHNSNN